MKKSVDKIIGRVTRQRGANGERKVLQKINIHLTGEQAKKWNPARGTEFVAVETQDGIFLRPANPPLTKIYLEPTLNCNLRCRTCMRNSWDEPSGDMPMETYSRLLRGLKNVQTFQTLAFWGFGEPLMHPQIVEMIRMARKQGIKTELISNGMLLNRELAGELVEAGLDTIVFSIDGTTPESYSGVREGSSLSAVLENVKGLRDARIMKFRRNPEIGIEYVLMKSNLPDLANIIPLAREMEAGFIILTNLLPYVESMKDEILYWLAASGIFPAARSKWHPEIILPRFDTRPENMKYLKELIEHSAASGYQPDRNSRAEGSCPFVRKGSAAVSWDGKVSPCVALMHSYTCYVLGREKKMLRHTVGDVSAESMTEIWNREEYSRFRERVMEFDFSPCVGCGGCDMSETNGEDCIGSPFPTCGDCLWAKGVIVCP
ncbi:MAG: radical SAM protein [bacterium]